VDTLVFAPDDTRLYGIGNGLVVEWNGHLSQPSRRVTDTPDWFRATSVAYRPDGKEMAVGDSVREKVLLVDTTTGRTQDIFDSPAEHLAYSEDGSRLLATGPVGGAKEGFFPSMEFELPIQAPTGKSEVGPAPVEEPASMPAPAADVEPAPADEPSDATPAVPKAAAVLPAATHNEDSQSDVPRGATATAMAMSVLGGRALPAPTRIVVWDTAAKKKLFDVQRDLGPTTKPEFVDDGQRIYLGIKAPQGPVLVLDATSGEVQRTLPLAPQSGLEESPLADIAVSADRKILAATTQGEEIPALLNADDGTRLDAFSEIPPGESTPAQESVDFQQLRFGGPQGKLAHVLVTHGLKWMNYRHLSTLLNPSEILARKMNRVDFLGMPMTGGVHGATSCNDVAFLGDKHVAYGLGDGTIAIADARFEVPRSLLPTATAHLLTLFSHHAPIYRLAGHPGGNELAAVSADGELRVWDVAKARANLDPQCIDCVARWPSRAEYSEQQSGYVYQVCKFVWEQVTKECTYSVSIMVPEQRVKTFTAKDGKLSDIHYIAWKTVFETRTKTISYTVCKPVYETCMFLDPLRKARDAAAGKITEPKPGEPTEFVVWKGTGELLPPEELENALAKRPTLLLVGREFLQNCRLVPTYFVEDENTLIVLDPSAPTIAPAPILAAPQALADQKPYRASYGKIPIEVQTLSNPAAQTPGGDEQPLTVKIGSLKAPAKLSPTKEIILFANPGKNFKLDLTVKFKTQEPSKLAANLRLKDAKILPPEFLQELEQNHITTWHFDTESRPGYRSAEGESEMTFDLIGLAPKEKGTFSFDLDVGLYDKKTWGTMAQSRYKVTLITDPQLFESAEPSSVKAPEVPVPWTAIDGRVIQALFVKLQGEAVVINKDGKQFTIPFAKLAPASVEQAKKLAGEKP
jgi:hypothetical protein